MTQHSKKSNRAAGALAGSLMLAPAVAALRTPMLVQEARELHPWRVETVRAVTEKTAAVIEGAVAAQMSLAYSASRFWLEICTGRMPSMLNGVAMEHAVHAALKPSRRKVKTNYNRLTRGG